MAAGDKSGGGQIAFPGESDLASRRLV